MTKYLIIAVVLFTTIIVAVSCNKNNLSIEDGGENDYILVAMPLMKPSNFPDFIYDTAKNPITRQGFELGRKLFYDVKLSGDNTISCGSCHIQTSGFTQHGHNVSHGINDLLGKRNSQPVMNLAWSKTFFWDGGVFDLDLQPLSPIENPVEMGADISEVLQKLNADINYTTMFEKAFGSKTVTTAALLKALSQFMLQCTSANSRYDMYVRNEDVQLIAEELEGRILFQQKCSGCHSTDLFTDNEFHNNGLAPTVINDKGRSLITLNSSDEYLFKTPSLRNLTYSAPYMHDGRFETLEEVLDHYSDGVQNSLTLDNELKKDNTLGIKLTEEEKNKIISFLKTLDDENFIRDPKLSEQ